MEASDEGRKSPRMNFAKSGRQQFRRTFIRQWRKHRQLTLEKLADRIGITASALSMLERGQRAYTQDTLEKLAEALMTDPASLLMRNPEDTEAIWSIWDEASPGERAQISEVVKALRRTGSTR